MKVPQTMHAKQVNRTFGSVLMNPQDRRQNGKQAFEASHAFSPVWVGCVSFPLTLALSRREREHRTPRCDESRFSRLPKARQTILPPMERAGVRGKPRSKHQALANCR